MTAHSVAPIDGDKIVKLEILGLASFDPEEPMRDDLKWVDVDIFDQRKNSVYFYSDPAENLYDNPAKLKKILLKLKNASERYGKRIGLAKRVVTFDMGKLYDGKGRITKIYPNRVDVEKIEGKYKHGYVYYTVLNLEYLGREEFVITPEEI